MGFLTRPSFPWQSFRLSILHLLLVPLLLRLGGTVNGQVLPRSHRQSLRHVAHPYLRHSFRSRLMGAHLLLWRFASDLQLPATRGQVRRVSTSFQTELYANNCTWTGVPGKQTNNKQTSNKTPLEITHDDRGIRISRHDRIRDRVF